MDLICFLFYIASQICDEVDTHRKLRRTVVDLLLSSTHVFQFVHVFDSESEKHKKKLDAGGCVTGVVFEGRSTRGGDDDESTRK
ncbi:hypothetical protein YC2023_107415 [Brassica napus]